MPKPPEEWREIAGYDGWYEVSNLGRVRSWMPTGKGHKRLAEARIRKLVPNLRGGYLTVMLMRNKQRTLRYVHHLVLEAFVGPRSEGMEGRHKDGDALNNVPSNLAWATHPENEQDKFAHGTHTSGERNGGAKFTNEQAAQIQERTQTETVTALATEFGVSIATISQIKNGLRYRGGC